jgi:tetratricopeptide (TPR) repeat protein
MRALLFLLAAAAALSATDLAGEYFEKAGRFYEKGDYDSALVFYGKIQAMGIHDGRVYFNLGNVFFRKKELGRAILNYEIARTLDPSDEDIAANLRFAYASATDKIQKTRTSVMYRALSWAHNLVNIRAQGVLFLPLLWLLCGLFVFYLFAHPRFKRPASTACLVLLPLVLLFSISFVLKIRAEDRVQEAVVLAARVDVKNEPDGAQTLFSVHEGAKFTLVRRVGDWYLGSLENGLSGWVKAGDLGLIEISD